MSFRYKHVIVLGIDGAGAFIKDANTPNFDRIFADGGVTYDALSSNPTISAECWGSMLLGTSPKVHGLTNSIVGSRPYPTDSPFPSVFKRIRQVMPEAELGAFCDWNPIAYGIVEQNINVFTASAWDTRLTKVAGFYIKNLLPTFLFMQIDSVDWVGHSSGYGSPRHLEQIWKVDACLGDLYQAVVDGGLTDDTLFCVIADHGGNGHGHGGWTDSEKYVTFAATGKSVKKGQIGEMNVRDLSAIVLYALGIEQPEFCMEGWTSQVPADLFDEDDIPAYRDISAETGAVPRISRIPHTSELV